MKESLPSGGRESFSLYQMWVCSNILLDFSAGPSAAAASARLIILMNNMVQIQIGSGVKVRLHEHAITKG